MRVILTQNVPKLGEVGDVCHVAPGYGRNYLIPQGLAMPATPGAMKQIEDLKRTERRRQDRVRADMEDVATRIERLRLTFTAKVGEHGRLYGSITSSDIADAMAAELGEPVDRRKILLDESIRTLGEHPVSIHLMPGVDATVTVDVQPDEDFEPGIVPAPEAVIGDEAFGDEAADEIREAAEEEPVAVGAPAYAMDPSMEPEGGSEEQG
jgi:large subunit ribosomal protein L9